MAPSTAATPPRLGHRRRALLLRASVEAGILAAERGGQRDERLHRQVLGVAVPRHRRVYDDSRRTLKEPR
jgi:hypothetical protein